MDITLELGGMAFILFTMLISAFAFIVLTTNGKMGLVGLIVGLGMGFMILGMVQNKEASTWQYEELTRMRGRDCTIDEAIRKANADGNVRLVEFLRIKDLEAKINLKSARDALAEKPTVKCRS